MITWYGSSKYLDNGDNAMGYLLNELASRPLFENSSLHDALKESKSDEEYTIYCMLEHYIDLTQKLSNKLHIFDVVNAAQFIIPYYVKEERKKFAKEFRKFLIETNLHFVVLSREFSHELGYKYSEKLDISLCACDEDRIQELLHDLRGGKEVLEELGNNRSLYRNGK